MPEFLSLIPPDEARDLFLKSIGKTKPGVHKIKTINALGRITAAEIYSPQPLPVFTRSTVDGFAVKARDTYGASDSLPGYFSLIGEVPMGSFPTQSLLAGKCMLIHTGGMLPNGADAVVMLEYTQPVRKDEIEVQKAVATGENVIQIGEDVHENQVVIERGIRIRPAEIGGLMALGILNINVAKKIRVGLISSGDEVIPPNFQNQPGKVRDINSYTLGSLVTQTGGIPAFYGIVPDKFDLLKTTALQALNECDFVVITAGSSASTRDMTADVIDSLGKPGVLVHGINTRPGKPTILGVCDGKAVIGLPGNPVSALVNAGLFVVPLIEAMLGISRSKPVASIKAKLSLNISSQAGREDWQPVRLVPTESGWLADPIFGKSNLIFTLVAADGLIKIHSDANGINAGEIVDVYLMN